MDRVVLGAWGRDAYGNSVKKVASLWSKDHRLPHSSVTVERKKRGLGHAENWFGIREVVFAIKERSMAQQSSEYFGENAQVECEDEAAAKDGAELWDEWIQELNRRITELEIQIPQARTGVLKSRLEDILASLQQQLNNRNGFNLDRIETEDGS
ncbi:hypothetical protein VTO42DRAFT_8497 [Malbranchea cinnamomea]